MTPPVAKPQPPTTPTSDETKEAIQLHLVENSQPSADKFTSRMRLFFEIKLRAVTSVTVSITMRIILNDCHDEETSSNVLYLLVGLFGKMGLGVFLVLDGPLVSAFKQILDFSILLSQYLVQLSNILLVLFFVFRYQFRVILDTSR
ncbi:hypothetical protein PROFUN_12510 [Planoprotostelium fungivorum]|uniref:Uncharacterized protein n=1 Tax=Planoprotostelium fungivorum TaxID=1890364 RepID=A0A2P6MS31_9EUKA|nr:hypothetical protein PROFUN_12510 [Planoprotostelium fungivorum]